MTKKTKDAYTVWERAVEIPTEKILPHPKNPNEMDETTFNRLKQMIEENGFDEPIQVVPHPDDALLEDGYYMILGGEHRHRAAKEIGLSSVPAVVLKGLSEHDIATKMVQRNMVRGELQSSKFAGLVEEVRKGNRTWTDEDIAERMGMQKKVLISHLNKAKTKESDEGGEDGEKGPENADGDEYASRKKVYDNLAYVVGDLMKQYGDTIPQGFMLFFHKNKLHLLVQCDEELYLRMQELTEKAKRDHDSISTYLSNLFERAAMDDNWPQVDDIEPPEETDDSPVDYE